MISESEGGKRVKRVMIVSGILIAAGVLVVSFVSFKPLPNVKVGILHSQSGTMAISEQEVARVTVAAFEEINAQGGILGYQIVPVVADGRSDPGRSAQEARRLIEEEKVKALFGCWTSSCRKAVKPLVEKHHHLLFYPVQYEGFEASPAIVYLGQVPNQQIRPAVKYAIDHFGKNFYLVGSNYIFPRAANHYIRDIASILGAGIAGESYHPLGGTDFRQIVREIKKSSPDVIFNTLNGESNLHFFRELHAQGIDASHIPVISFSIAENEIRKMGETIDHDALIGHYAGWSYFASLENNENRAFRKFLKRHSISALPGDAMEAAYNGVHVYKQAVEECGSFEPRIVRRCIPMQSFNGAGGILYIDPSNNHSWKSSRIGRITPALEFEIVYDSVRPIQPENYPRHKSLREWNAQMQFYEHQPFCELKR